MGMCHFSKMLHFIQIQYFYYDVLLAASDWQTPYLELPKVHWDSLKYHTSIHDMPLGIKTIAQSAHSTKVSKLINFIYYVNLSKTHAFHLLIYTFVSLEVNYGVL